MFKSGVVRVGLAVGSFGSLSPRLQLFRNQVKRISIALPKDNGGLNRNRRVNKFVLAGAGTLLSLSGLQYLYGSEKDFFEYRFITNKDIDDVASFYGGEEFMELFCVIPFMGTLMMRGADICDDGTIRTTGLPGTLTVSMVFSDEEADDESTMWFNKRERFKDVWLGLTMWDMVTNFGVERLPDGRIECYHHGEYFHGKIPFLSLAVRLVFQIHSRWVAWATEHYINHYAFTSETDEEEEIEENARKDMPLTLLKEFLWKDSKAMLFGHNVYDRSFLLKKRQYEEAYLQSHEEKHLNNLETHDEKATIRKTNEIFENPNEVLKKRATKIKEDIALDSEQKINIDQIDSLHKDANGPAAWEMLRKTNNPEAYQKATKIAMRKHETRSVIAKRRSTKAKANRD